jgi:hypothetical protein
MFYRQTGHWSWDTSIEGLFVFATIDLNSDWQEKPSNGKISVQNTTGKGMENAELAINVSKS